MDIMYLILLIHLVYALIPQRPNIINLKPRGGGNNDVQVVQVLTNFAFTTSLEIGTPLQEFVLSVAILYPHIWVEGNPCKKCKKVYQQYLPSSSSTSVNTQEVSVYSDDDKMLNFHGVKYNDLMSIGGFAVETQIFVADKFVDPLSLAEDGILGLGNDSSSIVYKLYEEGDLSEPIYSLYSGQADGDYLIFDSINFTDLGLSVDEEIQLPILSSHKAIFSYNGTEYDSAPIEFSSISSYISGPYELINNLFSDLTQEYGCYYFEELIVCDCAGSYPDISFIIDDITLTITSQSYLLPIETACFLSISVAGKRWVLGEPLLKEYFTSVNLKANTINFYKVSQIEVVVLGTFETFEGWAVIIFAVAGSFFIYVSAAGIYQLIKRKLDAEEEQPFLQSEDNKVVRKI